ACATDRISATADSLVGSVGTIFPHMEVSGFLKGIGYSATVFTNADSPKKGHGNMYEPLSDEARETLQTFVDSYGRPFIEDVARYRGIEPDAVVANFGQGDAMRADVAIKSGMVDAIAENFHAVVGSLLKGDANPSPSNSVSPVVTGITPVSTESQEMKVSQKVRAQLFALGFIKSMDASDETCIVALTAFFKGQVPDNEGAVLKGLRAEEEKPDSEDEEPSEEDDEPEEEDEDEEPSDEDEGKDEAENRTRRGSSRGGRRRRRNIQQTHDAEMGEARLGQLRAAAKLFNRVAGADAVTAEMVMDAFDAGMKPEAAANLWSKAVSQSQSSVSGNRVNVTGNGSDRFASDAVDALLFRSLENTSSLQISDAAMSLTSKPLWAVAGECLQHSGHRVDMYGDRELIASTAMSMGQPFERRVMFSAGENPRYTVQAGPVNRPGDFPNILSALANKYLDMIELDDDYSYPDVSAVLPGGLNDFKPAPMVNKGIVEELDVLEDSEKLKELGIEEEVLSYIFMQRFGNSFGWTPVMVANDDMNAFAEGMLGLREAWEVTQNRLVVERFTQNEQLLDGNALFADRPNTGTGTNPAANNNDRSSGAAPNDSEWEAMEVMYADIGGVATGRRVRGTLNTIFCPTGAVTHEATRYFANLNLVGESKEATTTQNLGLFRGKVNIVPESELRVSSSQIYYGLRSPTKLNTATVVRGYFNGYGQAGRREQWYDPTDKTTYISLEGRIAVAVKNWRYAVRNAGA
ncbi:MAG: S49 family peptidase, partial [Planctomycetota bacterium]